MHVFSFGVAILVVITIIGIGAAYLIRPQIMTGNFGLPPPGADANTRWWLRLKGSRDIVSGLVLLAMLIWGTPHLVGVVLLVEAVTPIADMTTILAARGSTGTAIGVHGVTAGLMVLAAIPLLLRLA